VQSLSLQRAHLVAAHAFLVGIPNHVVNVFFLFLLPANRHKDTYYSYNN
jgi:hypothetical protein